MPFKRPAAAQHDSGSSSRQTPDDDASTPPPAKRARGAKLFPDIAVHIIQAKLDGHAVAELHALAERHCARIAERAADADVLVTAVSMRRRLERHVAWDVAKSKAVVTPAWLRDSVAAGTPLACAPYVALQDLREETIRNCPTCDTEPCECADTDVEDERAPGPEAHYPSPPASSGSPPKTPLLAGADAELRTKANLDSPPSGSKTKIKAKAAEAAKTASCPVPAHLLPPLPPLPTDLSKLHYNAKYACQRASPLVCPNQALAVELDIIKRSRALESEERSALSYSRAISVVKAYPRRLTSMRQIAELPYIGAKLTGLVQEFMDSGQISEARTIASSERFKALTLFSSIYGIGPSTARRLYALGLRTVEDLEVYFGVLPEEEESQLVELEHREKPGRADDAGLGETWIKIALGLRKDFELKVPRAEVEEMGRVITDELNVLEPGCVSTIVGGYRRGKPESNDVDIVFTHPDASKSKGLCKRLVQHLHQRGMVTHVMHLSGFHGHNPLRTTHWDSLEKALTVFVLPPASPRYAGVRRRVDLICAQPEVYWCAVVGWSGSIMFQRDLRQWAKDKTGMKFDSSGIVRRYDSKAFYPKTEKEVFDLLGLEWIDPVWRNADL
ncbi:Nucleotidyltransferase [Phanerochaete sordida]|uniref:DNA-directed DNA polymerase n=1 Tax=Phanerochaete sordida TaxID=48140 RepID=A0A9P3LHF9_9APHY|nr:Nucleotidyltransferase [Phanerochaete sordida]